MLPTLPGLGKLYRQMDHRGRPRSISHRHDDVPRDGHDVLAGEGRGGNVEFGEIDQPTSPLPVI